VLLTVAPFLCGPAAAQAYPTKPVRMIVGTAPGGGTDMQARLLAKRFQETMSQRFVVDNRPGASGMIGAELTARAPADGYTLFVATALLATNAILYKKLAFDPAKDLAPISQISFAPQFLIVHPAVPARTPREFVTIATRQSGRLNAASSGTGSANHLALEMFKLASGIKVTHVPYKSGAPAIAAVMSGEVDFSFTGAVTALPQIRAGKVRPLAVTSLKPSSVLPKVPTLAEIYPGFESANWYALFAPAGTPSAILSRLSEETAKAIKAPEMRDFIAGEGAEPVGGTPQELAALFKRDFDRYTKVVAAANVRVE
jgi:tripartite-type tricarboxylate transporter receptor subunit TctC